MGDLAQAEIAVLPFRFLNSGQISGQMGSLGVLTVIALLLSELSQKQHGIDFALAPEVLVKINEVSGKVNARLRTIRKRSGIEEGIAEQHSCLTYD